MATEEIYGRNPVLEALRANRRRYFQLQLAQGLEPDSRLNELTELAEKRQIPIERVKRSQFEAYPGNAQGVSLRASPYPYVEVADMLALAERRGELPWLLLLDVLQDPQNVATLLRSAEAVGVHGVVLPPRRSASITPAVVSASSGASEHLLVARANLVQTIERLKGEGVWVTGLEGSEQARPLAQADLNGAMALVVGGESEGLRHLVRQSCDFLVQLPMRGRVASLNAAAAGAVALYFILAARGFPGPPDSING